MIDCIDKDVDRDAVSSFVVVIGDGAAEGDDAADDGDALQRSHVLSALVEADH